jgi:N-acetylglucosaminyldiphosphoundecaprenol N-acetyl-beta-D-mannosaminyltransferase
MDSTSRIISLAVNNISFQDSLKLVADQGMAYRSGFVCFANVHMTIEAYKDTLFSKDLEQAFLVLPDGKPVAMACRWLYKKKQERVAGMDFMPALFERAHQLHGKIFLYGSTDAVLQKIIQKAGELYPNAIIAGAISPPFRQLTTSETQDHIRKINDSGAHFVLVALGCPKQEKWMATHYRSIHAVLLGLGGAFPVMAGIQKRSPEWMQRLALEWFYRLLQEPRRMFRRYFYTNISFIYLLLKEILKKRIVPERKKAVF